MAGSPSHISRLDGISVDRTPAGTSTTESAELLQPRLQLFALLMCALFSVLYLVGLVVVAVFHPDFFIRIHLHPSKLINLGAALGALGVYLWLRRRACSPAVLRALDVGLTLGITFSGIAAVTLFPVGYVTLAVALLLMAITLTLRAALVPSPPRRATALGLCTAVPMAYAGYTLAKGDPALPALLTPLSVMLVAVVWSSAITGVTTVTSREIYGLTRPTTGRYYFSGMYTAVLPMIPGIWAIVRTLRASRAARAAA